MRIKFFSKKNDTWRKKVNQGKATEILTFQNQAFFFLKGKKYLMKLTQMCIFRDQMCGVPKANQDNTAK